jgi:ATP-binding cassette subfamily F protein 3
MDLPAKETLESAFQAYQGTMLFVSHDRYLVSQVADTLLVLEGGQVWYYPFGYRHYLEKKKTPVEAENQALISGLRNVPKGSRIPGGRMTERELSLEWEADRLWEQLDRVEKEILDLQEKADALQQEELRLFCEGDDRNLQDQILKIRQNLSEVLSIYADNAAALDELTGEEDASPQTEENREMSP